VVQKVLKSDDADCNHVHCLKLSFHFLENTAFYNDKWPEISITAMYVGTALIKGLLDRLIYFHRIICVLKSLLLNDGIVGKLIVHPAAVQIP
jgi:hypothetical protein